MKIRDAIAELQKNLIRYTHEAKTGTRFKGGKKMTEKGILRRQRSLSSAEEVIAVLQGWNQTKHRADLPFSEIEQLVIDMYEIDIHDIITPVMPG